MKLVKHDWWGIQGHMTLQQYKEVMACKELNPFRHLGSIPEFRECLITFNDVTNESLILDQVLTLFPDIELEN